MKKFFIASALATVLIVTGCGEQAPEPERIQPEHGLEVETYAESKSQVSKINVDGTTCVIFSTYNGSGITCDWSETP
jgi:hypothetical protein